MRVADEVSGGFHVSIPSGNAVTRFFLPDMSFRLSDQVPRTTVNKGKDRKEYDENAQYFTLVFLSQNWKRMYLIRDLLSTIF